MKWMISVLFSVFIRACGEYEIELGGGYKYMKLDGRNAAIVYGESTIVVDANVTRYRVIDSYIVGERSDADIDERLSKNYGYFILDMRDINLVEGLNKNDFENALRARNLSIAPFTYSIVPF